MSLMASLFCWRKVPYFFTALKDIIEDFEDVVEKEFLLHFRVSGLYIMQIVIAEPGGDVVVFNVTVSDDWVWLEDCIDSVFNQE